LKRKESILTEDIFLSIAVPTYNRAKFLDKSLNSLCKSVYKSERRDIEILILDNASSDKTSNNFKKAISLSRGKYIWIFGDDDLVFDDTIKYLMQILDSSSEFGIIHLKAQNFIDKIKPVEFKEFNNFKIYDNNKAEFIKEAHTNLTFITSNIVNKSLFDRIDLDITPGYISPIDMERNKIFSGFPVFIVDIGMPHNAIAVSHFP